MTRGYHWLGSSSTLSARGSPAAIAGGSSKPSASSSASWELATLVVAHVGERRIADDVLDAAAFRRSHRESLIGLPVRKVQFCDRPVSQA